MNNRFLSLAQRLCQWRLPLALLLAALAVLGGWHVWRASVSGPASGQWVGVRTDSNSQPIILDGLLEPATSINITAPFDGKIVKMPVRTGDQVAAGATLMEIASSELLAELRDAEAAMLRAQQTLDQLVSWGSSPEMLAAQRQLSTSQTARGSAQRNFDEIKSLYEKGIVPRIEFEASEREVASSQAQVSAAMDGLAAMREKGGTVQRKLAQLDLENRRAKLTDTMDKLSRAVIKSPLSGVALYPAVPAGASTNPVKELEVGSFVTSKDTLIAIGDTTNLAAGGSLDEFDILRVKPGTPVEVILNSNPAMRFKAQVRRVSSQAKQSNPHEGPTRAPSFEMDVLIRDVEPQARNALRIGMSVRMHVHPEAGGASLLVPLDAVSTAPDGSRQVMRRTRGSDKASRVPVKLGKTLLDQVEVVSGVTAADEVWIPPNTALTKEDSGPRPSLRGRRLPDE